MMCQIFLVPLRLYLQTQMPDLSRVGDPIEATVRVNQLLQSKAHRTTTFFKQIKFFASIVGLVFTFRAETCSHTAPTLYRFCLVLSVLFLVKAGLLCLHWTCCLCCLPRQRRAMLMGQPSEEENPNGATGDEIEQLEKRQYSEEDGQIAKEDAVCAVCLDEYEVGAELRLLPCGHHFHLDCADQWLVINRTCPLCVKPISGHSRRSRSRGESRQSRRERRRARRAESYSSPDGGVERGESGSRRHRRSRHHRASSGGDRAVLTTEMMEAPVSEPPQGEELDVLSFSPAGTETPTRAAAANLSGEESEGGDTFDSAGTRPSLSRMTTVLRSSATEDEWSELEQDVVLSPIIETAASMLATHSDSPMDTPSHGRRTPNRPNENHEAPAGSAEAQAEPIAATDTRREETGVMTDAQPEEPSESSQPTLETEPRASELAVETEPPQQESRVEVPQPAQQQLRSQSDAERAVEPSVDVPQVEVAVEDVELETRTRGDGSGSGHSADENV